MKPSSPRKTHLFPPPPPWHSLYTDENLQLHLERRRIEDDGHVLGEHTLPKLVLDPPAPLLDGAMFRMFGRTLTVNACQPTLEDANVTILYDPAGDRRAELRRLVLLALQHYRDALRGLAMLPSADAMAKIRVLLLNAMHLANTFREQQALETVAMLRELTLSDAVKAVLNVRRSIVSCSTALENVFTPATAP